jgi:hypothetical protein
MFYIGLFIAIIFVIVIYFYRSKKNIPLKKQETDPEIQEEFESAEPELPKEPRKKELTISQEEIDTIIKGSTPYDYYGKTGVSMQQKDQINNDKQVIENEDTPSALENALINGSNNDIMLDIE